MNTLRALWATLTAPLVVDDPNPQPSRLDHADGVGTRCAVLDCTAPGVVPIRAGFDNYLTCEQHAPVRV